MFFKAIDCLTLSDKLVWLLDEDYHWYDYRNHDYEDERRNDYWDGSDKRLEVSKQIVESRQELIDYYLQCKNTGKMNDRNYDDLLEKGILFTENAAEILIDCMDGDLWRKINGQLENMISYLKMAERACRANQKKNNAHKSPPLALTQEDKTQRC